MSVPQQLSGFNNQIPPRKTIKTITAAYRVTGSDYGQILSCAGTASFTLSLTAAPSMGVGFSCWIWNQAGTSASSVTIDPNGSETIDGVATLILYRGEGTEIICDGVNWQTGTKKTMRGYAESYLSTAARPVVGTLNPSTAIGTARATSSNTFAANIGSTTSYGATSSGATAIGFFSAASGTGSLALGNSTTASATGAVAISGNVAIASGSYSVAIGNANSGNSNGARATAEGSCVLGIAPISEYDGKYAYASGDDLGQSPTFYSGLQYGLTVLRNFSTSATPVVLISSPTYAAAGSTNQLILPNNSAFTFSILVVARQQAVGGTASAAWKIEGLARREATAATTTLVASTVTTISNVPAWTIAIAADTTNGCLSLTATGAAATNIMWVATAQTSETVYA